MWVKRGAQIDVFGTWSKLVKGEHKKWDLNGNVKELWKNVDKVIIKAVSVSYIFLLDAVGGADTFFKFSIIPIYYQIF